MNFHEDVKKYHNNVEAHMGYSVVGNYFKGIAYDLDDSGKITQVGSNKFSSYEKLVEWITDHAPSVHKIKVIGPRDSADLESRLKLQKINKDSDIFQFIMAPRPKKFSIQFFASTKDLCGKIENYYPKGDDITHAPALISALKANYAYTGSLLEIQFDDMFYFNMVPFFVSQEGITLCRLTITVDSYEEAIEIMNKYKKG